MTMNATPVRLAMRDIRRASLLLGRAFHDDPFLNHLLPDPVKRERLSPKGYRCIVRYGVRYGEVHTTSSSIEALAIWLPPQSADASLLKLATVGGFSLPFTVGPRFIFRFLDYVRLVDDLRQKHASFPHWYLQLLGVEPRVQRQGYGSALLKPMLDRFDEEKAECSLDTMKGDNLSFYERFGFKVVAEGKVPKTNVTLWLMTRKFGRQRVLPH